MNTQEIDFQNRIQNHNGLFGDHYSHASHYSGEQQTWNTGLGVHAPVFDRGLQDHHRCFTPDKPCNSIMSRFESPASAFYATERYLGLQQYDGQVSVPSMCSQHSKFRDSGIPAQHSLKEDCSVDSGDNSDNFGILRGSLDAFTTDNCYGKSCKNLCIPYFGGKYHPDESIRVLSKDYGSFQSHFLAPTRGNQDHQVCCNHPVSPHAPLEFLSGEEKQSSRCSFGGVSAFSGNSTSSRTVVASKTRIRWTQSLHEKFVDCVNRLGGAERATPKAILKLMDSDDLTIFHVKSHLQKYRIAKYMPDSSEGRIEKSTGITDVSLIDTKTGLQLREALQLQLDVQRRLHEQLEIQKNLQLRIEEQGKQLKMMFDQQQKSSMVDSLMKNQSLDPASQDGHNVWLEDFEVSADDGSANAHFHAKIS